MNKARIFRYGFITAAALLSGAFLVGCPVDAPPDPARRVKLAADYEFLERKDGLPALQEAYGFQFDEVYGMAVGLTHEALRAGDVDAAKGFATDGKIKELALINLVDDRGFFPVYYPAPVIREEILEQYPEVAAVMAKVARRLDTDTMLYLNYLVDIEMDEPAAVARDWLLGEELIAEFPEQPVDGDPVIVGSKDFTEQIILGQITILALDCAGIPVVDSTNLGGTEANRSALLKGTIHIYWEYTGTAWSIFYDEEEEVISDPDEVYRRIARRDAAEGLVWLDYAPFNNTYTIMMRQEHAAALGITTISQLAEWVKQVQADGFEQ
jgi:osmoprotectant transport system substrate-binding protein